MFDQINRFYIHTKWGNSIFDKLIDSTCIDKTACLSRLCELSLMVQYILISFIVYKFNNC